MSEQSSNSHDKHIQESVRLSESKLWDIQKNYFETMGINAWEEDVPFYITNNTFIAYQYASLMHQFMLDWQNQKDPDQMIYIMELGCGTGKFSYYFLKALTQLLIEQPLTVSFCYVISDVTAKNTEFCENNLSFKPYIELGQVDFAVFDASCDTDFYLKLADKPFSECRKSPLVVISNYIFDCLPHDLLHIQEGKIHSLQYGLKSRYKNFDQQNVKYLNELKFDITMEPIELEAFYDDPKLIGILNGYLERMDGKPSMMPVPLAALKFLKNMQVLTKDNMFLIIGDKGVSSLENISRLPNNYRMTFEGCHTLLANLFIIGDYIKALGGDCVLSQKSTVFQVGLYSLGTAFENLPNTQFSYTQNIDCLGPQEFASFYSMAIQNAYRFSANSINTFMKFSRWDPDAYALIHDRLVEIAPALMPHEVIELKSDLKKIEDNIYRLGLGFDVANLLGLFYQSQGNIEKAKALFQTAMDIYDDYGPPHNNIAMIYEEQKDKEKAIYHYGKAYEYDKKNLFAKQRMEILQGKKYAILGRPFLRTLGVIALIGALVYVMVK
tara:strand:- start:51183 stop:52841 length:1659 start_codon:yes stop_codon:yes gene_type:complete